MTRALLVMLSITLTAAACGGSGSSSSDLEAAIEAETGQNVDIDQDGDSLTIDTDDGSITLGADSSSDFSVTDTDGNTFSASGSGEVPADFPLPVPDNVEITTVTTFELPEGTTFGLIFNFDPSRADEISALYVDALNSLGATVDSSESPNGDGVVITGSSDTVFVAVITTNYGDYFEANISWTPM